MPQSFILESDLERPGEGLGSWSIGLGIFLATLGVIASLNLYLASMATLVLLGAVMVAGGFAQILHAVSMPSRRRALAWGAAGVFYLMAGCLVFFAPNRAAMEAIDGT
jgi:uncharacterized membrane protein HdeD (DUF308 family)